MIKILDREFVKYAKRLIAAYERVVFMKVTYFDMDTPEFGVLAKLQDKLFEKIKKLVK